jgi:hypothetical protein
MKSEPASILLVVTGILFVAFLLIKMFRLPAAKTPQWEEARRKIQEAKQRGRDTAIDPKQRASAWRAAATAALEGLRRPGLAASYARRAERLDPQDAEAVGLLVLSLRRASRYRALERFLWQRLAIVSEPQDPGDERAFQELLRLYEGPLQRPEMAAALRRMRPSSAS